jgi:hypothetical protein
MKVNDLADNLHEAYVQSLSAGASINNIWLNVALHLVDEGFLKEGVVEE